MTRVLLHAVFLKMRKVTHGFIHLLLFFCFDLYLNTYSKEMYSFVIIRKKKKFVIQSIQSFFANCL